MPQDGIGVGFHSMHSAIYFVLFTLFPHLRSLNSTNANGGGRASFLMLTALMRPYFPKILSISRSLTSSGRLDT